METESNQTGCTCGAPGCSGSNTELVSIQLPTMPVAVQFSREELQVMVDRAAALGITAKPAGFTATVQAFVSGAVPAQRSAS